MSNVKLISAVMLFGAFIFSCSNLTQIEVQEKTDEKLKIEVQNSIHKFYVSNIYKDIVLGELFWERPNEKMFQITYDKQNISAIVFDSSRDLVLYCQSQKQEKSDEILVLNTPYRFSDYQIISFDLNTNEKKILFELSNQNIIGQIQNMGIMKNNRLLVFQTHYGEIYFLDFTNPSTAMKFIPEVDHSNQFKNSEIYRLKTDGKDCLFFDAVSGYKSKNDSSFVYNTFKYNINTNEINKLSDNSYYMEK